MPLSEITTYILSTRHLPPPQKKISHAQVCEECEEMNFFFNELTEMVKQVGIEKILHPEFTFKNEIVSKDNTV